MAEPNELFPTPTRLALLADVLALKVADAIWQMKHAGWVYQPQRGLDILEGRR